MRNLYGGYLLKHNSNNVFNIPCTSTVFGPAVCNIFTYLS